MAVSARKHDPDHITLSKEEFVTIARNGGSKSVFKDWLRVIVAVAVPVIVLITFFNKTAFQVEHNKEDILKHEIVLVDNAKAMAAIKDSISEIRKQQAVILERIEGVRKDIERLNN